MNRITRKRSPRSGSSKGKPNPFESRGLDKFQEVYSELERMRYRIAEERGVSTSDVWFTRATNNSSRGWIPVVVGKSRTSSPSSQLEKSASIPHWGVEPEVNDPQHVSEECQVLQAGGLHPPAESQRPSKSCWSSWFTMRLEQFLQDMQQGARKALKAITLFIMVVAAVADVLIALVAGFASSLIARYLRPLWARYLPQQHNRDLSFASPAALGSINTSPTPPPRAFFSSPSSPRFHPAQSESPHKVAGGLRCSASSRSTPVSPMRTGSPTYFSSGRPGFSSSPEKRVHGPQRFQKKQQQGELDCSLAPAEEGRGVTPVMCVLLVILVGLSFGRLAAALMASAAWFLLPVVEKLRGSNTGLKKR